MKVTVIGSGNMGGAMARALAKGTFLSASDITCTAKSSATLERMRACNPEFRLTTDNVAAVQGADIVIVAVKPWLVESVMAEVREALDLKRQIIVSVAAGVTFSQLRSYLVPQTDGGNPESGRNVGPVLFRVIPNTAVEVMEGVVFVAADNASPEQTELIVRMFDELGCVFPVKEEQMAAGTALASCGIAFAMRYIRAAAQAGVALGFSPAQAHSIVEQTVKGAAELLLQNGNHPEAEIDKVTTPGGITIKGLNEMEHNGFTSSVIKGLEACVK